MVEFSYFLCLLLMAMAWTFSDHSVKSVLNDEKLFPFSSLPFLLSTSPSLRFLFPTSLPLFSSPFTLEVGPLIAASKSGSAH